MFRTPIAKPGSNGRGVEAYLVSEHSTCGWHFVEDFAGNDAIALRLAQTLSQHFARDSGNEALQFQKMTHVVLAKMPEDQRVSICRR
jgi:hypothetical protein